MQAIDIVKPEPRTALEAFERWQNWTAARLRTNPTAPRLIIAIKKIDTDEEEPTVWGPPEDLTPPFRDRDDYWPSQEEIDT